MTHGGRRENAYSNPILQASLSPVFTPASRGPVDAIHGVCGPLSTAGQKRMEGVQRMEEIQGMLSQRFHLCYPVVGIHISQIDFSQFQILTEW